MKRFFFDTETTGLIKNSVQRLSEQPRIIELFALICEDEKEIGHYHSVFNPGLTITDEIIKITSIKNDELANAPKFSSQIVIIDQFLDGCDEIIGHNLKFDVAMLTNEYKRAGKVLKLPAKKTCTIEQTEYLKGFRLNLGALHELLFGELFKGAHRAEADVRAMARCFFELKRKELI